MLRGRKGQRKNSGAGQKREVELLPYILFSVLHIPWLDADQMLANEANPVHANQCLKPVHVNQCLKPVHAETMARFGQPVREPAGPAHCF